VLFLFGWRACDDCVDLDFHDRPRTWDREGCVVDSWPVRYFVGEIGCKRKVNTERREGEGEGHTRPASTLSMPGPALHL
jgi:hypothetical protein